MITFISKILIEEYLQVRCLLEDVSGCQWMSVDVSGCQSSDYYFGDISDQYWKMSVMSVMSLIVSGCQ